MRLDRWVLSRTYGREFSEKDEGLLPVYTGSPTVGLRNSFGWQLQGYIEDEQGRLRLQTEEEQRFCMGCHSAVGVTVDQTSCVSSEGFPRNPSDWPVTLKGSRVHNTRETLSG